VSQDYVIELKNVIKDYPLGTKKVRVLKNISLQIKSGEFVILYGPSGSGKTTLLNIIGGLDKPSGGEVLIRGENIVKGKSNDLAKHRLTRIGVVFQDFNLIKSMTAQENVAMPLVFDNTGLKQRTKRAAELLKEMGLEDRIDHKPIELSGGEQQRVAIARSMVNNPWILLVDEPTGNLDTKAAEEIMQIILSLNKKSKRTVILVTHNPNYLSFADKVVYLQDGFIVKEVGKQ
jgi:putative ABC transport system ATP-binding protein